MRKKLNSLRCIEIVQQFISIFNDLEDATENLLFMQNVDRSHNTNVVFEFIEE